MKHAVIDRDGSVKVVPFIEWAMWFEHCPALRHFSEGGRMINRTKLPDGVTVSTVFLGMDHQVFGRGAPLWFETMIFGGEHDQYQTRCSTFEEAETDHERALAIAKGEEDVHG